MRWLTVHRAVACALALSGLFHVAAVVFPRISMPEPASEHVLFAGFNFFLARSVWVRVWRKDEAHLVAVLALLLTLALQQTQRHGQAIFDAPTDAQTVVQSVLAIVSMWALLIWVLNRATPERA